LRNVASGNGGERIAVKNERQSPEYTAEFRQTMSDLAQAKRELTGELN
jgi:hypothetical protein